MVKAVLFDLDGTLVDSVEQHARAWQDAFAEHGRDVSLDALRQQIGKGGDQLLPVFLDHSELEAKGAAIEAYRSGIFARRYRPTVRPFPEVQALLMRLRDAGIRIALASSGKAEEVAFYQRLLRIEDMVDLATSSEDADRSKPHPDIFQAALAQLGERPRDALAVGDSPYDAEAAGKCGLRTIGLLGGGFPERTLREAGCIAIYRDPADLLAQFEQSPLAA